MTIAEARRRTTAPIATRAALADSTDATMAAPSRWARSASHAAAPSPSGMPTTRPMATGHAASMIVNTLVVARLAPRWSSSWRAKRCWRRAAAAARSANAPSSTTPWAAARATRLEAVAALDLAVTSASRGRSTVAPARLERFVIRAAAARTSSISDTRMLAGSIGATQPIERPISANGSIAPTASTPSPSSTTSLGTGRNWPVNRLGSVSATCPTTTRPRSCGSAMDATSPAITTSHRVGVQLCGSVPSRTTTAWASRSIPASPKTVPSGAARAR